MALYQLRNYQISQRSEIFRSVSNEMQENVQSFCFAIFFSNHSLHVFDSDSRNSVEFQTISGPSVLLSFLSYDHLSVLIHQCYMSNVGDDSDSNRELQYEIQFVKVSTTRHVVRESFKYNIL